jgi:hypothetical protein
MNAVFRAAMMSFVCLANATGQGKLLTIDHQTGLRLIPATDPGKHFVHIVVHIQRTHTNARSPNLQEQIQRESDPCSDTRKDGLPMIDGTKEVNITGTPRDRQKARRATVEWDCLLNRNARLTVNTSSERKHHES